MTNRRKMKVAIPAVLTSFALLAASCGSDDADTTPEGSTAAEGTTAAEGSTEAEGTTAAPEGDRSITVALVGNDNI